MNKSVINSAKNKQNLTSTLASSSTPNNNNMNSSSILKFPGLARPSILTTNDNKNRLIHTQSIDSSSLFLTSSLNNRNEKRNNTNCSFEQFNASCDDAWNDKIEDKISYPNIEKNSSNTSNNKLKFGNNKSSILIKELQYSADSTSTQVNCSTNENELLDKKSEVMTETEKQNSSNEPDRPKCDDPKVAKLKKLLYEDEMIDINQLRTIAWSGITDEDRPLAWKLLLGYVPTLKSKRSIVIQNKKIEYENLVAQYYYKKQDNDEMYRQIHIDIPRMQPLISIFQQRIVQEIFERILYIWSIRHPASGYVQGMNDLVTPFFVTYLSEYVPEHSFANVESFNVSTLPADILATIESDSYWSFNKLLDSIQDNYTFAQPGIQRLVNLLGRVVSRVDNKLHEHLENNSVQYMQFAFRWMNNLLIREIPLRCIIRLWDTYLSEGTLTSTYVPSTNFSDSLELNNWSMNSGTPFSSAFHLFVCAAFLKFWSKSLLQETDFQGLMLLLQNLPTFHWSEKEVKLLVADAYTLKYSFSPSHLKN